MATNSKIEWCHHTDNLWIGCTEVHAGCDNCYARVLTHRWGKDLWGNDKRRQRVKSVWTSLDKQQRMAETSGEIHRVFVGSLMDIAEKSKKLFRPYLDHMTTTDDLRQELFTRITWGPESEGLYPNLFFLFLTKRPSNIPKIVPAGWLDEPPKNVMWLTSVSDQKTYNTLMLQLLKIKGKKGLSIEPQIGPIDLRLNERWCDKTEDAHECDTIGTHLSWIIQGGESGPHKRPFNLDWARSMRDQCKDAGVPYFFKQIDKIQQIPEDLMVRQFPV